MTDIRSLNRTHFNLDTQALADLVAQQFNTNPFVITDTTLHTGLKGYAIVAITAVVINTIVGSPHIQGNALNGVTLTAGSIIHVPVDQLQLTSGSAIVYRKQ